MRIGAVVLAELRAGNRDRAALLVTVKHGGTARVLRHDSNCCSPSRGAPAVSRACARVRAR
jgi:hypothetical protein